MKQSTYIPRSELQRLFPIVMCVDEAMNIVYSSDKLRSYLPEVVDNPELNAVFRVLRPGKLATYADAMESLDSLVLLAAHNGQFAFRGQLLRTHYADEPVLCLCGAPWLFWMSRNCPEVHLGLNDFSPADVQLDQLFFMSTEKLMVADLENLNTELTEAKYRLEEAHDAQHRFFAQMSHEMRTPLNGVVSALALLETKSLDSKQEQLVTLAQGASRNLMEVINSVLDLSRMELAEEDENIDFNLPQLIQSSLNIVETKALEKSLDLRMELSPDVPAHCSGSPTRIRQVLLNLVMNAIKFTEKGSITVRVQKITDEGPRCTLRFSVEDTGAGIATELQQRIFEPYYSVHPEGEGHPDAGTGLGLDIVRRNVQHMGGELGVVSEPGVGSTFWFDCPSSVVSAGSSSDVENCDEDHAVLGGSGEMQLSGNILLVDDNQTNLLLGGMILESLGLEVSTAEDGSEAVTAVLQRDFDLVLMDIHMPEVDGMEATRQIREHKNIQELPIVALTALSYQKEKDACLEVGMNGYLTKPIVREELASELSRWLGVEQSSESAHSATGGGSEGVDSEHLKLLDHAVLQELEKQISRDNLVTVLGKVLAEAAQRWDELVSADEADDRAAVQRHVHSLSSIFRSVGLAPAADALGDIEVQLRAGDEVAAGWLDDIAALEAASLDALEEILRQYAPIDAPAG